jgi:hypothetical protein
MVNLLTVGFLKGGNFATDEPGGISVPSRWRREIREWVALINPGSARFASISHELGVDQPREWLRGGNNEQDGLAGD